MTTLRRLYYDYPIYHIIARGNNRQMILRGQDNKKSLGDSLAKYKSRYSFKLYAFVLMDNHFHLIIETCPQHNISRVMQGVLLSYSNKYRNRYDYVGHVWQGRFISKVIRTEQQLIQNIEYIHNNPVRAGMVSLAVDYLWSSARFYEGISNSGDTLDIAVDRFMEDTSNISL